jgi:hypothetical protein
VEIEFLEVSEEFNDDNDIYWSSFIWNLTPLHNIVKRGISDV